MTTSGTATFDFNRDQIIKSALRKIGAIAQNETPDAATIRDCADQLNIMVKAWSASGIHLWTETEATLFTQPRQSTYTLGAGTSDHATESYVATELAASAAAAASSVTVESTSSVTIADKIGITLDDGTLHWSTVSSKTTTAISFPDALTDSASEGGAVYTYTTGIIRPLRVVAARRYDFISGIDTPMRSMSRLDYRDLPNKNGVGQPIQFFYDPRGGTNTQGKYYIWPTPTSANIAINFTWYRPIQDFTTAGDTSDLPVEWLDALIWNLALNMAPEYDVGAQKYAIIEKRAMGALDLVIGWDREPESYYFQPDYSFY